MANERLIKMHNSLELIDLIKSSLIKLGKSTDNITVDDLASFEEFHIGERTATRNFLNQFHFSAHDHVLDIGCGTGGTARYLSSKFKAKVTGIDINESLVDIGIKINSWLKLEDKVRLLHRDALNIPLDNSTFTGAYMMHVGMYIENKTALFKEIFRVLQSGSLFGIYDIMKVSEGELNSTIPWVMNLEYSNSSRLEDYTRHLTDSGFEILKINNLKGFALGYFKKLKEKIESMDGIHIFSFYRMTKERTLSEIKNLMDCINSDLISPIEIIAVKNRFSKII